jgi:hypothetical protein
MLEIKTSRILRNLKIYKTLIIVKIHASAWILTPQHKGICIANSVAIKSEILLLYSVILLLFPEMG